MKDNEKLQGDVEEAIKWEPLLEAAEIGVIAQNGIITLTGTVDSYAKKRGAEHAAKTVKGVLAVIEKIEVKFENKGKKTDMEVVTEILKTLKSNPAIPEQTLQVKVEDGWVTMEGVVQWNAQKDAVQKAVEVIAGIRNVANNIQVKSDTLR